MFTPRTLMISLLLLSGSIFCYALPVDSDLFTTYTNDNAKTTLYWVVCGSIPPGFGCYSSGQVGPFGKLGSIVEGRKVYNNAYACENGFSSIDWGDFGCCIHGRE